ncbi:MAG: outer membrane beta-barrel protein [Crocinitomicaceae bacterium]|nr:outer membrane beta-barrel protein [Crocinitomicaceae bacterium]
MKKGLLLGVLLLGAGVANAQNMYVGLQTGYGFGMPTDVVGTKTVYDVNNDPTETNIYGSYGGGFNLGLDIGYNFSEYLGAELGVSYFMGSSVTSTDVTTSAGGTATISAKSTQVRVSPLLVVSTGGDVALYGKGGFVLPVGGSTEAQVVDNTNPAASLEQDLTTKGALSLGFQGALGLRFDMASNLSIFGEVSAVNLRIKSGSQTLTRFMVGANDFLESSDTYSKETIFVDELTPTSNNDDYNSNTDFNSAKEELASKTNFSAIFINVGIKYNF